MLLRLFGNINLKTLPAGIEPTFDSYLECLSNFY